MAACYFTTDYLLNFKGLILVLQVMSQENASLRRSGERVEGEER